MDQNWTDRENNTNFESNLAMMVIYLPVNFEFDKSVFELESRNENVDRQKMDKRMEGITPILTVTLATMVIYLPVNIEFDWTVFLS